MTRVRPRPATSAKKPESAFPAFALEGGGSEGIKDCRILPDIAEIPFPDIAR